MVLKLFNIAEQATIDASDYFLINNSNKDARMVSFETVSGLITAEAGGVNFVNGQSGNVTLTPDDLNDDATAHKFVSASQISSLASAIQPSDLSTVATTGNYSDGIGTPSLATVATTGGYSDLTGSPSLATVATTGNWNDLIDKPGIADIPVQSVNGQTGAVSLNADNILDVGTDHRFVTVAQLGLINNSLQPGAAVVSINSKNGASVVLNPDDLDDASTEHKFVSLTQRQAIGTAVKLQGAAVPPLSSSPGTNRELRADATHLYFYAETAWVRVAWATF